MGEPNSTGLAPVSSEGYSRMNARIEDNTTTMSATMNIRKPLGADLTMTKNLDTA